VSNNNTLKVNLRNSFKNTKIHLNTILKTNLFYIFLSVFCLRYFNQTCFYMVLKLDLGLKPGWIEEKIKKVMIWCDPADPVKPGCNPLIFIFFLLKRYRFDFFLNRDWPGRPGDPVKIRNPSLGPTGFKNYTFLSFIYLFFFVTWY
jgi:hypothetical protein